MYHDCLHRDSMGDWKDTVDNGKDVLESFVFCAWEGTSQSASKPDWFVTTNSCLVVICHVHRFVSVVSAMVKIICGNGRDIVVLWHWCIQFEIAMRMG